MAAFDHLTHAVPRVATIAMLAGILIGASAAATRRSAAATFADDASLPAAPSLLETPTVTAEALPAWVY